MFVLITPPGETEQPLYSNQNNDIKFDLEITNQTYVAPVATQSQTTWNLTDAESNIHVSNSFTGNQEHNYTNPQHSMTIYTSGYSGNLTIQASLLENSPQSTYPNSEWGNLFTVNLSNTSSLQHFTFTMNANWLRVLNQPNSNSSADAVTQIQVRN